jgi:hypothetical protein
MEPAAPAALERERALTAVLQWPNLYKRFCQLQREASGATAHAHHLAAIGTNQHTLLKAERRQRRAYTLAFHRDRDWRRAEGEAVQAERARRLREYHEACGPRTETPPPSDPTTPTPSGFREAGVAGLQPAPEGSGDPTGSAGHSTPRAMAHAVLEHLVPWTWRLAEEGAAQALLAEVWATLEACASRRASDVGGAGQPLQAAGSQSSLISGESLGWSPASSEDDSEEEEEEGEGDICLSQHEVACLALLRSDVALVPSLCCAAAKFLAASHWYPALSLGAFF